MILSLQIVTRFLCLDWIFNAVENFLYTTIRNLATQIIALILLFVFVKGPNSLIAYTIIMTGTNVISNIANYFFAQKYCHIRFVINKKLLKHLKSILLLFALDITISVYLNADLLILGFLKNDYSVGLYSVSAKICTIVKNSLLLLFLVFLPRLSYYLGQKKIEDYHKTLNELNNTIFSLLLPIFTGMCLLSKEIILVAAGNEYVPATLTFILLTISLIFAFRAYFWSQCILIPNNKEKIVLIVTIISAFINVILNFLLIPKYDFNAAALSTIISEFIVYYICKIEGKKTINFKTDFKIIFKTLIGCLSIVIITLILKTVITSIIIRTFLSIILSILVFIFVEIKINNYIIKENYNILINKVKNIKFCTNKDIN